MNIKFKKLVMHNFFSFGDAEIDLSVLGYTLVKGINRNPSDSALSNGSGKSSWGEAILYALTGDTLRGTNSIVNLHGDDGCFVDLTFDIDNVPYQVIRYKNYSKIGTNLKLFVNGEDKSGKGIRETEKVLSTYLPDLTTGLIGAVIILGQGLPMRFSNNTPSGRKEVLENLSKSDFMIEDIKKRIEKRKSELSVELRSWEDEIVRNKSLIESYTRQIDKIQEQIDSIDTTRDFDGEISQISQKVEYLQGQLDESNANIDKIQADLDATNEKIYSIDGHLQQRLQEIRDAHKQNLEELNNLINEKTLEQRSLLAKINELESITDVCPTCGQKIPGVVKVDTTSLHEKTNTNTQQINEWTAQRKSIENEINNACCAEKTTSNESKQLFIQAKSEIMRELNDQKSISTQISRDIANFNIALGEVKVAKALFFDKLDSFRKSVNDCRASIEETSEKLVYNEGERDRCKLRVDTVSKLYNFATRDFRGILLIDIINFIQKVSEKYCESVFGNKLIEFALEGNNIDIKYDNKYYESLSGGEKQKIDLIVQFALREMLQKFIGFSSNIIILDEILDNIDSYGTQRVLDMIQQNLSDIDTVFIISHHSDSLAIPYDNELIIEKDANGVSRVL